MSAARPFVRIRAVSQTVETASVLQSVGIELFFSLSSLTHLEIASPPDVTLFVHL